MSDGRSRSGRYVGGLRTFVVEHPRTLAVDAVVLTAWALLLLGLFVLGLLPRVVLYVGLVAGVVSYSLVAKWREPGRVD